MNLWFRLLAFLFQVRGRTPLTNTSDVSVVTSRCWPNDLDTSMHMNNGRYLTLMDIGRLDWTVRCGLLRELYARGWIPVATTASTRFVREIRLWTRFRIETRIVGWLETQLFFEHRFVFESGPRTGELACIALVKAGIYDRKARRMIPIDELFEVTGLDGTQPEMRDDVAAFLAAETALTRTGKSAV